MASFQLFEDKLLEAEGGYQASPADSGNYNSLGQLVGTNRGISAPVYEDWINRPPSVADMKAITMEEALDIYENNYWDYLGLDLLNCQEVAEIICDHAINAGPSRAGKMIQTCCNLMGSSLIVDGVVGPNTRNAINSQNSAELNDSFKQCRYYYYDYISAMLDEVPDYWYDLFKSWGVGSSSSNQIFHTGWINRVNTFPWLSGENGGTIVSTIAAANPVAVNFDAKKKLRRNTRFTRS